MRKLRAWIKSSLRNLNAGEIQLEKSDTDELQSPNQLDGLKVSDTGSKFDNN